MTDFAEALANPIKYQSELERRAAQLAIMADEEREEEQEGDDSLSLKEAGGSTPECASPSSSKSTMEYLRRTGSSKPASSKDGSPTMGPQRTDSARSLAVGKDEVAVPASLETANLTPESLERILEHKSVREKQVGTGLESRSHTLLLFGSQFTLFHTKFYFLISNQFFLMQLQIISYNFLGNSFTHFVASSVTLFLIPPQAERDSKLEQLRKKRRKDMGKLQEKLLRTPSKPKNPLGIIKKKFSTPNLESPPSASSSPLDEVANLIN